MRPRTVLRSIGGVVLPAMVFLAGCPQECAPEPASAPSGPGVFSEDFSDPQAFSQRFDHGWAGEVQAGALFGAAANDWPADHDMSCGDPNATHRTIHVTPPAGEPGAPAGSKKDVEQAFYTCLPGGDPAKGHVMTSVNTEGYAVAWFSPKPTFTDVHRVCWAQNLTRLGGGKWTQIAFLTAAEVARSGGDLGFTSPEFASRNGPTTPMGGAQYGVRVLRDPSDGLEAWRNGDFTGQRVQGATTTDKAPRYQHCVTDNENGTLAVSIAQPNGSVRQATVAGEIPNGPIRVVFEDDSYNPDKHFDANGVAPNSSGLYTWHWDDVTVDAAG
jgi:hypothetical protein